MEQNLTRNKLGEVVDVYYKYIHCGGRIEEHDKAIMDRLGAADGRSAARMVPTRMALAGCEVPEFVPRNERLEAGVGGRDGLSHAGH